MRVRDRRDRQGTALRRESGAAEQKISEQAGGGGGGPRRAQIAQVRSVEGSQVGLPQRAEREVEVERERGGQIRQICVARHTGSDRK